MTAIRRLALAALVVEVLGQRHCDGRRARPPAAALSRRRSERRRISGRRALRREAGDDQIARRRGNTGQAAFGAPAGPGDSRGERRGREDRIGKLSSAHDRGRRPDRLSGDPGPVPAPRPLRGLVGARQAGAAASVAERLAVDGAGHLRLSHQAALVRQRDAGGERALLRDGGGRSDSPHHLLPCGK